MLAQQLMCSSFHKSQLTLLQSISTNTGEPPKNTFNFPDLLLTHLQFYRVAAGWLQGTEAEESAKEFTCSYAEVLCSTDPSAQPPLVFIELQCIDTWQTTEHKWVQQLGNEDISKDHFTQHLLHSFSSSVTATRQSQ